MLRHHRVSDYHDNMFGKHFEAMYEGSMAGAGAINFAVWGYCIAKAKPPGVVEVNPIIAAAAIGITKEEVISALDYLQSPDPESRTKEHGGARLVHVDAFLYELPSWEKWNSIRKDAHRREQNRLAAQRYREKRRQQSSSESAHIDVDVDLDGDEDMDGCQDEGFPPSQQNGVPAPPSTRTGASTAGREAVPVLREARKAREAAQDAPGSTIAQGGL